MYVVYIWKWSSAHALGASVVWHHSLLLMNSFNKTEAAVFSCRLCFLRAFHFISLVSYFNVNVYIIAREKLFHQFKIGRAPYGARLITYYAGRAPFDTYRASADLIIYRRRPAPARYVSKRKFFKIWYPGVYQICRWFANRWNHTASVSFVTIAYGINVCERMRIRSHSLIYVWSTLGTRSVLHSMSKWFLRQINFKTFVLRTYHCSF